LVTGALINFIRSEVYKIEKIKGLHSKDDEQQKNFSKFNAIYVYTI